MLAVARARLRRGSGVAQGWPRLFVERVRKEPSIRPTSTHAARLTDLDVAPPRHAKDPLSVPKFGGQRRSERCSTNLGDDFGCFLHTAGWGDMGHRTGPRTPTRPAKAPARSAAGRPQYWPTYGAPAAPVSECARGEAAGRTRATAAPGALETHPKCTHEDNHSR